MIQDGAPPRRPIRVARSEYASEANSQSEWSPVQIARTAASPRGVSRAHGSEHGSRKPQQIVRTTKIGGRSHKGKPGPWLRDGSGVSPRPLNGGGHGAQGKHERSGSGSGERQHRENCCQANKLFTRDDRPNAHTAAMALACRLQSQSEWRTTQCKLKMQTETARHD